MSLNKTVLKLNALFLLLIGSLQIIFELLSHFMGAGPLADRFLESPYTLGFFEAHGLAVLMGILLWRAAANPQKFWHQLAAIIHILLGGGNLSGIVLFNWILLHRVLWQLYFMEFSL